MILIKANLCYLNRCARSPYPRGTPQSGLLRLAADPGDIPAELEKTRQDPKKIGKRPRRNPTNLDKNPHGTSKKVSKNPIKIGSGSVPGVSRMRPGPIRNTPERQKCKKTACGAKKATDNFFKARFWVDFGTRPGAQNRQKTGPGAKKCVRRRRRKRFLSFFLAVAVRSRSPDQFSEGLTLQNCAPTTAGARF